MYSKEKKTICFRCEPSVKQKKEKDTATLSILCRICNFGTTLSKDNVDIEELCSSVVELYNDRIMVLHESLLKSLGSSIEARIREFGINEYAITLIDETLNFRISLKTRQEDYHDTLFFVIQMYILRKEKGLVYGALLIFLKKLTRQLGRYTTWRKNTKLLEENF